MNKAQKLFDQFPPVSTEAWKELIITDLKGADFTKKLVWKTNMGFSVNPYYRAEDTDKLKYINTLPGKFPFLRGTKTDDNSWLIRQDILVRDFAEANRKALSILGRGIDSLGFMIEDPATVNIENFRILLNDIHLEAIELNILSNGKAKEIVDIIAFIAAEKGSDPNLLRGAVEADPLWRLMLNGTLCLPVDKGLDYLAQLTSLSGQLPLFRTLHINASLFGNAGTSLTEELAYGIAMGSEYMTQLTNRGISSSLAASKIRFSFGTGSDFFPEIAKLRAARLLWSVVMKGFGIRDIKMEIHSVTAEWNKTVYDPYVNMLRTQTEAMAAVLGGTDSLTVLPFDKAFRNPDEFSERIARNQQLILREEAYFDKVADPAAGSWYVENLTNMIADSAWKLFIEIDEKGGFLEGVQTGFIQKKIEASAASKRKDYATRKSVLVGTSQFPDNRETLSSSADKSRIAGGRTFDQDINVQPVVPFRISEDFDKIRMAVNAAKKTPVVFLLTVGNLLMRNARAKFSTGFFGCAGYTVIDNPGFDTVDEGIEAALGSKADIVVICSADADYLCVAPQIFSALKGKTIVVIAGDPAASEELREKGIDQFIHMKTDVPATLSVFNELLGIKM